MNVNGPKPRFSRPTWALLLVLAPMLAAAPARAEEPADVSAPPAEASTQLTLSLETLGCGVWGGDGEGLPAIWEVLADLELRNGGDQPVRIEGGTWRLPLGERQLRGRIEGKPFDLAPGGVRLVASSAYLPLDQLDVIREGVRSASLRRERRLTGVVEFTVGGRERYLPFTLTGRWRGCSDERPAGEPLYRVYDDQDRDP